MNLQLSIRLYYTDLQTLMNRLGSREPDTVCYPWLCCIAHALISRRLCLQCLWAKPLTLHAVLDMLNLLVSHSWELWWPATNSYANIIHHCLPHIALASARSKLRRKASNVWQICGMTSRSHAARHREITKQAMHPHWGAVGMQCLYTECRWHTPEGPSGTSILGGTTSALTELGGDLSKNNPGFVSVATSGLSGRNPACKSVFRSAGCVTY